MHVPSVRRAVRAAVLAATLAAACVVGASAAWADGGKWPSTAPDLPFGQHVTGGEPALGAVYGQHWQHPEEPGVRFWRAPLAFGDRLTVDYENVAEGGTGLCMLAPDVTDYTVAESECVHQDSTYVKDQMVFTSSADGGWLLAVYARGDGGDQWAYDLIATVRHRTTLALRGPKRSRKGQTVTLTGALTPALPGRVTLQRKVKGRWRHAKTVTAAADGSFLFEHRLKTLGTLRFRAAFAGDDSHLASRSSQWKVKSRR